MCRVLRPMGPMRARFIAHVQVMWSKNRSHGPCNELSVLVPSVPSPSNHAGRVVRYAGVPASMWKWPKDEEKTTKNGPLQDHTKPQLKFGHAASFQSWTFVRKMFGPIPIRGDPSLAFKSWANLGWCRVASRACEKSRRPPAHVAAGVWPALPRSGCLSKMWIKKKVWFPHDNHRKSKCFPKCLLKPIGAYFQAHLSVPNLSFPKKSKPRNPHRNLVQITWQLCVRHTKTTCRPRFTLNPKNNIQDFIWQHFLNGKHCSHFVALTSNNALRIYRVFAHMWLYLLEHTLKLQHQWLSLSCRFLATNVAQKPVMFMVQNYEKFCLWK